MNQLKNLSHQRTCTSSNLVKTQTEAMESLYVIPCKKLDELLLLEQLIKNPTLMWKIKSRMRRNELLSSSDTSIDLCWLTDESLILEDMDCLRVLMVFKKVISMKMGIWEWAVRNIQLSLLISSFISQMMQSKNIQMILVNLRMVTNFHLEIFKDTLT